MIVIASLLLAAAASAAPARSLPHYEMDVTLLPETHEMRVVGTLTVHADATLDKVEFSLMDIMSNVTFESTPAGTVTAAAAPLPGAGNLERTLTLAQPLHAGKEISLRFSYETRTESKFVYHIGTDAMLAGGPTSAWYPEVRDRKGLGTVRYHYPRRYSIVAGGTAQESVDGETRTTTVEYRKPSTFSFIAAEFTRHERKGTVPMRAYVLRDRPGLEAYLDGCSRILAFLTREFGSYPYDGFALVEAPGSAAHPAGFSGASFEGYMVASSSDLDTPFNLAYFAHEIGHQWWGNLVTKQGDAGGQLMSEGLAQFGSLRTVEELAGADAAERYRRSGYPGYNPDQCAAGYLRDAAAGLDAPLAAPTKGYVAMMHQLADSKGFLVLDHLSRVAGREHFRDALTEITRRYAFRSISWDEFKNIVQAHARHNLSSVFAQWFERTGAPSWDLHWQQEGKSIRGTFAQTEQPYTLDIPLLLVGHGRSAWRSVAIDGPRTSFAVNVPFEVQRIETDPHYTILHWTPESRAEADALAPFTRASEKFSEGDAAGAAAMFSAALDNVPPSDPYGLRFRLHYGYGRTLYVQQKSAEAEQQMLAAIAAPMRPPEILPWAYVSLASLAAKRMDFQNAAAYATAAISADRAAGGNTGASAAIAALFRENGLPMPTQP